MNPQNSWEGIYDLAQKAGAKFPEVVAAQWALESGFGASPSGRNNFFGLKGKGVILPTTEEVNGVLRKENASFLNFNSIQECVEFLVTRWYKDYKGYKGVNRAQSAEEIPALLYKEGYATDSKYPKKLLRIMNDQKRKAPATARQTPKVAPKAKPSPVSGIYKTTLKALNLSQPNAYTCQSACIGMAVGDGDVQSIRRKLQAVGTPGDPAVMGTVIRQYKVNYKFDDNASLSEIRQWLRDGEFLISHGWLTNSGHVICFDGVSIDEKNMSYKIDVADPWSEFDAPSWTYRSNKTFYDGYYSSYCIYAGFVAGQSRADAARIYRRGELDSSRKGAWCHRILR
jgi:hypothetical protein